MHTAAWHCQAPPVISTKNPRALSRYVAGGYVFDVATSLTYTLGVLTFVETRLFTGLVEQYLSDEEYAALQQVLVAQPDAGDVIRGSGGVRKLRWRAAGRGKPAGSGSSTT